MFCLYCIYCIICFLFDLTAIWIRWKYLIENVDGEQWTVGWRKMKKNCHFELGTPDTRFLALIYGYYFCFIFLEMCFGCCSALIHPFRKKTIHAIRKYENNRNWKGKREKYTKQLKTRPSIDPFGFCAVNITWTWYTFTLFFTYNTLVSCYQL